MKKILLIFIMLLNLVCSAQEDKTVTLTVSGSGKTLEESKTNALRSAIEQAFGAFISSKTEILNDNLVKDEIVSIANGNVQKYDVVSQVEIPNNGFAITLNATVSIDRLTSFAESKGVVVEFKGGMFGATIKLQKLNEDSEYIAIKNLLVQTLTALESSYNYSLKVNEPKLIEGEKYSILVEVTAKNNENYDKIWSFFKTTINQISLNEANALSITNTGKKIFFLKIDDKIYKLRNKKSINSIFNFCLVSSMMATSSFYIKNNLSAYKNKSIYAGQLFKAEIGKTDQEDLNKGYDGNYNFGHIISIPKKTVVLLNGNEINFLSIFKDNNLNYDKILESKLAYKYTDNYLRIVKFKDEDNIIKINTRFNFYIHQFDDYWHRYNNKLEYDFNYNLTDLEKIESFNIEKIPFEESIINYDLYRILD